MDYEGRPSTLWKEVVDRDLRSLHLNKEDVIKGKDKGRPYSRRNIDGVLILLTQIVEPIGGRTTIVCDAWPVRRQTYS